jgi:hypothetical protein
VAGIYDTALDRESAFERLQAGARPTVGGAGSGQATPGTADMSGQPRGWTDTVRDTLGEMVNSTGRKDSVIEAMAKSAARSMGTTAGRALVRGILGTLLGGSRKR